MLVVQVLALIVAWAIVPSPAMAQVFRCEDVATKQLTYSDQPCESGTTGGEMYIPPPADTGGPAYDEQALKERLDKLRQVYRPKETFAPTSPPSPPPVRFSAADEFIQCMKWTKDDGIELRDSREFRAKTCMEASSDRRTAGPACTRYLSSSNDLRDTRDRIAQICSGYAAAESPRQRGRKSPPRREAPSAITSCDNTGCWDNLGGRYNRGAGNTFFRDGSRIPCEMHGTTMYCN